jgi:DNA-binding transcriptional LysR family regulator
MSENDIRKLDLSLLLVFRELVRTGRTTEVAKRLNLSQSAVSHALGRLRSITNDPLFVRRQDGLDPTPKALDLVLSVEKMIGLAHELVGAGEGFQPNVSRRTFRIVGHDMAMTLVVAPLIKRLRMEAPAVRVALRSAIGNQAIELLERGHADIALGTFPALPSGYRVERVLRQKFVAVARKDHQLFRRRMTLGKYLEAEHLLVSFRAGFVGWVDAALQKKGLERRVMVSTPIFLVALATIAQTDLVATLPEQLALTHARRFGLAIRPCPIRVQPFDILAISHPRGSSDRGIEWLLDLIRSGSSETRQ